MEHRCASARARRNHADATEATPRTPQECYADYLTVFAHGDCWGDVGHCDIPSRNTGFAR